MGGRMRGRSGGESRQILGAALLVAALAVESRPASGQDVPRPDTLGANFDATVEGRGTRRDYDGLFGSWSIRFQQRRQDGSFAPPVSGTWDFRKTADGWVVEDVFDLSGGVDPTVTFRIFNPTEGAWMIQGSKPRRGTWDAGRTWSGDGSLFVVQRFGEDLLARIRYYDMKAQRFLWRADGSLDGGRTWIRDLWLIEAVRRPEPPL